MAPCRAISKGRGTARETRRPRSDEVLAQLEIAIGKEPIPLDDKEEQVDYGHDDIDAYLTEPEDAGNLGDVGG
ncbi:uncharacterized protein A4U43_C03F3100 [Asparagus officinalis]|uniref:Uncharacterized protein n=1 Tax=Asparagus officinalis TaxID=4686 RepID=A0A5P1F7G9_ASPOF|nr:uncharacterized protein A4U43_C03F3100 [Asparagus officinalis]